ncbi:hypothetical protein EIN_122210 [Entamoeba invadens IP1]|uniref:Uncharacterized protein n=1 Tax=Entamoeba invadens IP1 TaxID=370355 RepID=A0A0A1UB33_ENTIV|nr:hypothetical protein EIN_122210 [Entamoeba invadens IP1]ELP92310.1 hypothetical protein EIN_122210 [Entamoeba invadens IP1]|eukprot:XP_004259081.1 hypothetical protein EIN_122210 [Entamoeba invadens IP1]
MVLLFVLVILECNGINPSEDETYYPSSLLLEALKKLLKETEKVIRSYGLFSIEIEKHRKLFTPKLEITVQQMKICEDEMSSFLREIIEAKTIKKLTLMKWFEKIDECYDLHSTERGYGKYMFSLKTNLENIKHGADLSRTQKLRSYNDLMLQLMFFELKRKVLLQLGKETKIHKSVDFIRSQTRLGDFLESLKILYSDESLKIHRRPMLVLPKPQTPEHPPPKERPKVIPMKKETKSVRELLQEPYVPEGIDTKTQQGAVGGKQTSRETKQRSSLKQPSSPEKEKRRLKFAGTTTTMFDIMTQKDDKRRQRRLSTPDQKTPKSTPTLQRSLSEAEGKKKESGETKSEHSEQIRSGGQRTPRPQQSHPFDFGQQQQQQQLVVRPKVPREKRGEQKVLTSTEDQHERRQRRPSQTQTTKTPHQKTQQPQLAGKTSTVFKILTTKPSQDVFTTQRKRHTSAPQPKQKQTPASSVLHRSHSYVSGEHQQKDDPPTKDESSTEKETGKTDK